MTGSQFVYEKFDVEITRDIAGGSRWPGRGEAGHDSGLGGNREYADLRGLGWKAAGVTYAAEESLIKRIEGSADYEVEMGAIEEEALEDFEGLDLYGLDLGVASTVVALTAIGCLPCSSCNAGSFGGRHQEHYPLVAFFARRWHFQPLLRCAEEAGVGLECLYGGLVVFADDVRKMRDFARTLKVHRDLFRRARPKRGTGKSIQRGLPGI